MTDAAWWKRAVIYQVYPRSFQDSNGDGVGDLNGIAQRLEHLTQLGIDAVWISPIFPSPMRDFGYDVSDYCAIDPLFGSLADFDALLKSAHARGLKIILDFVPNHTSDQHPWFRASRASKLNAKRAGISGETRSPTARRRTTGRASSAARPGRATRRPANTTTTPT
jgi:alpha-glucosidase